jgi:hypothetical protein
MDGPSQAHPVGGRVPPARDPARRGLRAAAAALALALTALPPSAAAQGRSGAAAWGIETGGGALGSAAGFGLGIVIVAQDEDGCGDDLGCIFSDVALVLATASAGSALGAWGLGGAMDTGPSLLGAAIGSLAGAAAGLGMLKVVEEIDPMWDEGGPSVLSFTLTQGAVTALGSRIAAAVR